MFKFGKIFMFCGLCGLGAFVISLLVSLLIGGGEYLVGMLAFDFDETFAFMYAILPLSYLGMLAGCIGVPLYFNGIKIFALGQIANNTEKE